MSSIRNIRIAVLIYLIGTGFVSLLYAPKFLSYADDLNKSQAVVLFLGDASGAREKQAVALLKGGFAEFLLIPGNQEAFRYQNGELQRISLGALRRLHFRDLAKREPAPRERGILKAASSHAPYAGYPKHWENTHVEVFRAKRMMEEIGLRNALMVSSPLHMRRIKMISSRVFDPSVDRSTPESENTGSFGPFSVGFVPTLYEKLPETFWFLNPKDFEAVATEYIKIAWFQMYSLFGR